MYAGRAVCSPTYYEYTRADRQTDRWTDARPLLYAFGYAASGIKWQASKRMAIVDYYSLVRRTVISLGTVRWLPWRAVACRPRALISSPSSTMITTNWTRRVIRKRDLSLNQHVHLQWLLRYIQTCVSIFYILLLLFILFISFIYYKNRTRSTNILQCVSRYTATRLVPVASTNST